MLELKIEHVNMPLDDTLKQLGSYSDKLRSVYESGVYQEAECSLNLAKDESLLQKVQELAAEKVSQSLKYSIVVGIGGSNLGTKAVYDALKGSRDVAGEPGVRMLFAETTDPEQLDALTHLMTRVSSPDEVLITLISKSGGTTETIANFEILMQPLAEKFSNILERVVVITDEGSKLWQTADQKGIATLAIPGLVGGRYSVLSAVGLFPLLSVGIDVVRLRQGAVAVLGKCFDGNDIAAASAAALAQQYHAGRVINDNFFFHPELESLGKWYRQLMGESIGKKDDIHGQAVHVGITPTISLGSTDLHSVGQLYLGGPRDKFTTFVSSRSEVRMPLPQHRLLPELVPMISGKSAADVMDAILEGVKIAYDKADLPFMEVTLDAIDENSLGAFMQLKMLEMMYLGQLLQVNSFDQPSVEDYKIETKRLLEN
jgi:glucose-6-phosphate isomerase